MTEASNELKNKVMKLELTDVRQINMSTGRIDIFFTMKNQDFSMLVLKQDDGIFYPYSVYHLTDSACLFCQEKYQGGSCSISKNKVNKLFRRLIQIPSIRLEWLYVPYAGDEK